MEVTFVDILIMVLIAFVLWIMFDAWMQKFKKKPKQILKSQRSIYFELMNELGYNYYETHESFKQIKDYAEMTRINAEIRKGLQDYKNKKYAETK